MPALSDMGKGDFCGEINNSQVESLISSVRTTVNANQEVWEVADAVGYFNAQQKLNQE